MPSTTLAELSVHSPSFYALRTSSDHGREAKFRRRPDQARRKAPAASAAGGTGLADEHTSEGPWPAEVLDAAPSHAAHCRPRGTAMPGRSGTLPAAASL